MAPPRWRPSSSCARISSCSTCGLPDIDGFEVARRLLGAEGRTPQIVLTSSNDPTDLGEAIGASGARGFIPKGELTGTAVAALLR